ncbi:MAG: amidohydrolase [Chloroflexi bacterium]|nr:amidohydrolase [Chloroflexota bacterium]
MLTQDPLTPRAQLVAVEDGRIVALGRNQDREHLQGPGTRLVDCQGRTLVPGFVDAHMHFLALASPDASGLAVDCRPPKVTSIPELIATIRRRAEQVPPGTWIRATRYDEFHLRERRHPTRWELDQAAPDRPVKLSHRSGHACVLNSLALRLAGIHEERPEPPGGLFDRDLDTGRLTGLLFGMGRHLEKVLPPLSAEELTTGARLASQKCLSHGITAVHDATESNTLEDWRTFQRLRDSGALALRVTMMLGASALVEAAGQGLAHGSGDSWLRLGWAKTMLDETTGELEPSPQELRALVLDAQANGWPVAIHAIEEEAIAAALDVLEAAPTPDPFPKREGGNISSPRFGERLGERSAPLFRHRIEHCSVCPPPLLARLARVAPVVVTQPGFVYHSGERYLEEVDEAQRPWLYRTGSMLRVGLEVAGSSDAPVTPAEPLIGMYAAVTRRAESGQEVVPQEATSAGQALALFTTRAAYALGLEDELGSLAPGKRADMVLLGADPTSVPPDTIKDIRVEATYIDGRCVWER